VAAFWASQPDRLKNLGLRMRPDRDYPTYVENSETFKNTYLKPVHTGSGDIPTVPDFMAPPVAGAVRARIVFSTGLRTNGSSLRSPGNRMVMVAQTSEGQVFGTGRDMLRDILQRLHRQSLHPACRF